MIKHEENKEAYVCIGQRSAEQERQVSAVPGKW
jgi:hypothetical protein